jgi:aspartyl aminopeptidase
MFDHEEVGSLSAQGADSPFFSDTIARVAHALRSDFMALKARSNKAPVGLTFEVEQGSRRPNI